MQRITITLFNLYDADQTIFNELQLPAVMDRDDFIGRLMLDVGENEVCITNPRIFKIGIGVWSRGRLPVWEKLAAILNYEYNPIWNVDGTTTHTGSDSDSRSYGRDRSETEETETTGYISADNSEAWSNDTKTDHSRETGENIADTEDRSGRNEWTERRTGNIGVTTTQKMMTEEKEFWESYDLYNYIIRQFAKEFLLMVY